ncbi:putative sigma-54 modulation protein [Fervidobacterium changbaicum]|uniref:30S ribosomal protein S30 n=1 Tax=Fervidobacterium changbaicum TaxID=310769 RepID=A0AAE6CER3_9BACT|nr:HPF/RaiA family ribosome-associated protein [Fervidobacterium changbaicum]QAV33972.1 30S ribosomal protein S30 [Fervidobacterium changbaicum]SDH25237.1 putative sigma-54 modulation protein [Fervidobacterium changbaicum]
MDVKTFARGFELSEAIESYLDRKLEKVKRALGMFVSRDDVHIEARFDKDGPYYTLRLMTHINGKDIVVQEKANDIYGVIDIACDNFEKAIKRERELHKSYHKSSVKGLTEAMAEELSPRYEIEDEEDKIDSVKRVYLMQASLEEAIAQMDVMGHQFFVFRNVDTGEINMLYRKNGKYALIEFQE